MPLLKKESEFFPNSLFELSVESSPWWVAHVRSRQEKALARYLTPQGVAFYLPQIEHETHGGGRTRRSYLPLFPGYLFFRGGASERLAALQSRLIVKVLDVRNQEQLGSELLQLHALQRSGASLMPCEPLEEGATVRIVDGPFQGYTGVIVRGGVRPRLVVSISVLRKAVAVELDRGAVALLPSAVRSSANVRSVA